MNDETHNGWTNRETWALMLWISNDEGLQDTAHELVDLTDPHGIVATEDRVRDWIETLLSRNAYEEEYGSAQPEALAVMAEDVGSLWRVNWGEVAAALTTDVQELTSA